MEYDKSKITHNGIYAAVLLIILVAFAGNTATSQLVTQDDPQLRGIDVVEHQGDTIPMDVALTDENGRAVTVADYFHDDKPVILVMAYYTCPMLCGLVLNGVAEGAKGVSLVPGKDYRILTVSIDPLETHHLARAKKDNYVASMNKPGTAEGWTFFTAAEDQSKKLAEAIGFKYYYDEKNKQYAHAAVITILTSKGVVSRYLYGIEFNPRDLKFALMEASEGKIGTTVDRVLLYCFHYDPDAGGYVVFAANVMKLGGLGTLILLVMFLLFLWIRERRRRLLRQGAQ